MRDPDPNPEQYVREHLVRILRFYSKEPQADLCNQTVRVKPLLLEKAADEIERLRAVLQKIAGDNYTREDERLTSTQPMMIWQLVARNALEQSTREEK